MNALFPIHDFHAKFGMAYTGSTRLLYGEMLDLRVKRLKEEADELKDATTLLDACDALVDLLYIAGGTLYLQGPCPPLMLSKDFVKVHPEDFDWDVELDSDMRHLVLMVNDLVNTGKAVETTSLLKLWYFCNRIAYWTKLPVPELFANVHAANMRKERGCAKTSKYGNSYDIIKPEGWYGPDEEARNILVRAGFDPDKKVNFNANV